MQKIALLCALAAAGLSSCSSQGTTTVVPLYDFSTVRPHGVVSRLADGSPSVRIVEYPAPAPIDGGLTVAADGDPWLETTSGLARFEGGAFTQYPYPAPSAGESATQGYGVLVAGREGNVWGYGFQQNSFSQVQNYVIRANPSGAITAVPVTALWGIQGNVRDAAAGPDGRIWNVGNYQDAAGAFEGYLAAISPVALQIQTAYPFFRQHIMSAYAITPTGDGGMWVYAQNVDSSQPFPTLFRFARDIKITNIIRLGAARVGYMTAGPDGNVWFTDYIHGAIGKVTAGGKVTEYPLPSAIATPLHITVGNDGALWFTEISASKIGRITTSGSITEYATPTAKASPNYIVPAKTGPHLYFTEAGILKADSLAELTY